MMFKRWWRRIQQDTNLAALLRGAGWMYAGGALSIGLTFLQQITTANLLGIEDYGRLATVVSTLLLVLLLVDFRTLEASTKWIAQPQMKANPQAMAQTITWYLLVDVVMGLVGIGGVLLVAPWIATSLLETPALLDDIRLYALMLPFQLVARGVPTAVLRMVNRFDWLAAKSVAYAVLRLLLMSGAAYLGYGVGGVLVGAVIGDVINALALLIMLGWAWRRELATDKTRLLQWELPADLRAHLRLMGDLWVGASLRGLNQDALIPLVAWLTNATQVGLLRLGMDVAQLIPRIAEPIFISFYPHVVRLYEEGKWVAFVRYVRQTMLLMAGVTLPVLLALLLGGWVVLPLVLDNGAAVLPVALLLGAGYVSARVFLWLNPAMVAANLVRRQNGVAVLRLLVTVAGLSTLVPVYGAVAAAGVYSIVQVLDTGGRLALFRLYGMRERKGSS